MRRMTAFLVGLLMLPPATAAGASATVPYRGVVPEFPVLSGTGKGTTPVIAAPEGLLEVQIGHDTTSSSAYMNVSIETDNNLDGVFCGADDTGCGSLWQGAYRDIQQVGRTEQKTFYGGKARFVVDAPGDWTIHVSVDPVPLHSVRGTVRQPVISNGRVLNNNTTSSFADVEAVSVRGERFAGKTDAYGGYTLTVYGDTTYQLRARKPAAGNVPAFDAPAEQLAAESFLALDYPSWAITRDFNMSVKQPRDTTRIVPEAPLRLQGIAQAPIRILPKKPLRLTGVSSPGAGHSTDSEIEGEDGIRIEQGDPDIKPKIVVPEMGSIRSAPDIAPQKPSTGEGVAPEKPATLIETEDGIRIQQGDPEVDPEIRTNPVGLKTTPKKE